MPEQTFEQPNIEKTPVNPESNEQTLQQQTEQAPEAAQQAEIQRQKVSQVAVPQAEDRIPAGAITLPKVEAILSEGLENVYLSLDANTQQRFKQKGEETSHKVLDLLAKGKYKAVDILNLILDWLRLIPQVNKFYLEQEAKIKTDAILNLHQNK